MRILVEVPGGEWAGAWGAEAEVRRAVLAVLPSSVAWHVARDIIRESAAGVRVGLVGPGVWSVLRAPLVLCVCCLLVLPCGCARCGGSRGLS